VLEEADDPVGAAVQGELLLDGVAMREEGLRHVGADHGTAGGMG
jgi:hypothetical protein